MSCLIPDHLSQYEEQLQTDMAKAFSPVVKVFVNEGKCLQNKHSTFGKPSAAESELIWRHEIMS